MAGIGAITYGKSKYAQPSAFSKLAAFFRETVGVVEAGVHKTSIRFLEIVSAIDLFATLIRVFRKFVEVVGVEDSQTITIKVLFREVVNTVEDFLSRFSGMLFRETVGVISIAGVSIKRTFKEVVGLVDKLRLKVNGLYISIWLKRIFSTLPSYTKLAFPSITFTKRNNTTATYIKQERPAETTYTKRENIDTTWVKRNRPDDTI